MLLLETNYEINQLGTEVIEIEIELSGYRKKVQAAVDYPPSYSCIGSLAPYIALDPFVHPDSIETSWKKLLNSPVITCGITFLV